MSTTRKNKALVSFPSGTFFCGDNTFGFISDRCANEIAEMFDKATKEEGGRKKGPHDKKQK